VKVQIITPTVGSEDLVDALLSVHHQASDMDLEIKHMVVVDGPEFQEVVDARIVEAEKQNYSRENLQVMTLPYNTGGKGFYGHKIYAAATQLLLPDVDYVLFLDQDNWYEPNHVDSVVRAAILGGLDFSFSLRKFYTWDGEFHSNDNCASLGPWKIWDNGGHNLVDTGRGRIIPMENRIKTRNDVTVELVQSMGSDRTVIQSARVSTKGTEIVEATDGMEVVIDKRDRGLINFLMRDRHGTPFEHNAFTFYVEAPIFVFREFMRHRIASYNEESGRYKELEPVFYIPAEDRKLVQGGKPGAYSFYEGSKEQWLTAKQETIDAATKAYDAYTEMLNAGIAKEVARGVLPVGIYSSMFVTMNARGLMNFLSLRKDSPENRFPSYPQREIEMVAEKMEELWAEKMPITAELFREHGRVAP